MHDIYVALHEPKWIVELYKTKWKLMLNMNNNNDSTELLLP